MEAAAFAPENEPDPDRGHVGRIPVRNIWLLMLYASEFFRLHGKDRTGQEENPDDLPDLIAEVLAHAVAERQRRQLSLGYRTREAALNRVRGRIDMLATERRQLLSRGLVACRFGVLTIDTPRNRFVRAALETISRLVRRQELAHRCRKLANDMKAMGVSGVPPTRRQMSADRFGRHDAGDRYMVAAARLAFDLALPTEGVGANVLPLPDREDRWVRRLFERAVGGFYKVVLSPEGWRVSPGRMLKWQIEWRTARIDGILPNMKTDIVLDHPPSGRRIVVDTKFNRSQVGGGDPIADHAEGLLLHPSAGESVDETAVIQGHRIRFATVDLTAATSEIRVRLLQVCTRQPLG